MREAIIREVEQFLYREARLLDERRFHDWLALFTEDVRYWMPGRTSRYPVTSKAIGILDHERYDAEELSKAGELAIFDETKEHTAGPYCAPGYRHGLGRGFRPRARAISSPTSRSKMEIRRQSCGCSRITSFTEPGPKPSRTSILAGARTCSETSTAHGRSPAARLSWTRTSCWPRT